MKTLLLSRSQTEQLLDISLLLDTLKKGFESYSLERDTIGQRCVSTLSVGKPYSAMILFPGLLKDIPAYTVKVHSKFPGKQPAINGVIHLFDIETGNLLAIMDSTYITAIRTGLSGALATDILARKDAKKVAIVGAGVQGELQLKSLLLLRNIDQAFVYDINSDKSRRFAERMSQDLNIPVTQTRSLTEALSEADIIITATWARKPFLFQDMIQPGTHIMTLGPDEPGKCEVDSELIKRSLFVCDDKDLTVKMGAIHGAGLTHDAIHAEIGEILAGIKTGRTNPKQVTIYGAVGLPFQDLAAAWLIYKKATNSPMVKSFTFIDK